MVRLRNILRPPNSDPTLKFAPLRDTWTVYLLPTTSLHVNLPQSTPIPTCPNCPDPTYIKIFRPLNNLPKIFTMAKFSAAALTLFCLFTLSLARTSPENDDVTTQVSLPLAEAMPAVRLPSEPVKTGTVSNAAVANSVPLTKVTFRPVNRRFRVGSKHPCRHQFKIYPTLREIEEFPFGDDMIVPSGENSDFEDPVLHGEGRRFRRRWVRLHHHHDEDSDSDDDEDEERIKKIFKRYDYDRFDREKKLKVLKKMRKHFRHQNEEKEREKKGGFMKRVRKFLDHYF